MTALLGVNDGLAFERLNPQGQASIMLVCEYASNRLPERLGSLGLMRDVLDGTAARAAGAAELTERLSDLLDASAVLQRFSRLVYDCNRAHDAADVVPERCQGHIIPGNQGLDDVDRLIRRDEISEPFHGMISACLNSVSRRSPHALLVSIRSFEAPAVPETSPELKLGHGVDVRFASLLYDTFVRDGTYKVILDRRDSLADAQSYTLCRHGGGRNVLTVSISVRNDLSCSPLQRDKLARYIASVLRQALREKSSPQVEGIVCF
ncbi:N-formylglutamate amidohydrolase [Kordiimonas sp.]|uniref:N-formylglutamate amidohydrolase n=1 Tax=Kordiimonas sp. TaxID=1970157 RepID=UPI003A8E4688